MRARLTIAALSAAVLALAGCGEDRLSQAEFAKQGDALCAEAERKAEALGEPRDLQGVARQLDELVKISEDAKRRFSELKPPEDKQAAFDGYLQSIQRQIDKAKQLRDAASRNDEAALRSELANIDQLEQDSRNRARELGLNGCASET